MYSVCTFSATSRFKQTIFRQLEFNCPKLRLRPIIHGTNFLEVFSKSFFFVLFSSQAYRPLGLIVVLSSLTLNVKMVARRSHIADEIVDMDARFWRKKSGDHSAFLSINQDNSSTVSGFAHLETVCSYYLLRSMSVTYMYKGQTLNTAKVLAHEIGHALGMRHDNENPCEFNKCMACCAFSVHFAFVHPSLFANFLFFLAFFSKSQMSFATRKQDSTKRFRSSHFSVVKMVLSVSDEQELKACSQQWNDISSRWCGNDRNWSHMWTLIFILQHRFFLFLALVS